MRVKVYSACASDFTLIKFLKVSLISTSSYQNGSLIARKLMFSYNCTELLSTSAGNWKWLWHFTSDFTADQISQQVSLISTSTTLDPWLAQKVSYLVGACVRAIFAIWGGPKMALPVPETKIRDHFYRPNTPFKPRKNHFRNAFSPLESGLLAILFIWHILVLFLECKKAKNWKCDFGK